MYPITKTDMDVLRFAHFLALAAVTVRLLPKDWPGLKSRWLRPVILCGQHSLEIFCLGVFLAFAGHFVLAEFSGGGPVLQLVVSLAGIAHNVRHGVDHFVVQAFRRQECIAKKRRRRQRRYGGRGLMKSNPVTLLGLSLLAGFLAVAPVRADPASCEVPAYLLITESPLPKVEAAVKGGRPLDILVVGSRSSSIATSEASAYPGRLQATLKERLKVAINVSVELQIKKTAEEVAASLVKLVEVKKPTLVIWQTGTYDAMRSVDPEDFRAAVGEGVVALKEAGADVVLMNLQYSPRTETMISASPYLDNMRVVAQEYDVPLFDRFAIMRHWNDQGDFDLFSASHGLDLAKRVHDCIGRALAKFVVDAAHIDPAQQN